MSECEISNCGYYWQEEGEEGLDFFDPVEDPFNEDDPYVVTNPMAFY